MSTLRTIHQLATNPNLAVLRELPIWGVSGGKTADGRPDKSPKYWLRPWQHAKSSDPATWGTFAQIEEAARKYPTLVEHIGIFSSPACRVLDWDHKPHAETPLIVETQAGLFAHCYQEKSLSGRGLRCLFLADDPGFKKRAFELEPGVELEVFASHQYAILTGNTTNDAPVSEAGAELAQLLSVLEPEQPQPAPRSDTPRPTYTGNGTDLYEAAASAWNLHEELERRGYARKGQDRYLYPESETGMPGVVVQMRDGRLRCYSNHKSDPLANGHWNDVFDVFALLEHAGDYRVAAREARKLLGLERPARPAPARKTTVEEATALWDRHVTQVQSAANDHLTAMPLQHHMRDATMYTFVTVSQMAVEGNLAEGRGNLFNLQTGGMKALAAVIGCHHTDLKARLLWLADHGFLSMRRVDPADLRSGWVIELPADPRDLPFLKLRPPTSPTDRPQTKGVRKGEKFTPPPVDSPVKIGGGVNIPQPRNPYRPLLKVALLLSRHPGLTPSEVSARLGTRLNTVRKYLSQLAELGYLTPGGALRCPFRQFFEDMRAWDGERASRRLVRVFSGHCDFARRELVANTLTLTPSEHLSARLRRLLEMRETQIVRLLDGEAPHAVLGRAA